jgi:endonuclease/exonuclease/phosphatase (EEP) superfamily protein YafD
VFLDLALAGAVTAGVAALVVPMVWRDDPGASPAVALAGFAVLLLEVFAFHGGLALLGGAVFAGVFRRPWFAAALAALGAVHAGPGLIESARSGGEAPPGAFTVVSVNTLFTTADLETIAGIVDRERPDVIVFQEVMPDRASALLGRFREGYPHAAHDPREARSCVILSRGAFVGPVDRVPSHPAWPSAQPVARVEHEGREIAVMGVHLPSPTRGEFLPAGVEMAARVGLWARSRLDGADAPAGLILAGDFNAPLWTGRMRALREAGLREAHESAGSGRGATWPDKSPLRHAPGIRLDQVAFAGALRCVESRVLESVGSDHRPVLARFVWE